MLGRLSPPERPALKDRAKNQSPVNGAKDEFRIVPLDSPASLSPVYGALVFSPVL